ncbi:alginate O-acetyltransferase AlgX-related protein [Deinococcus alpinitundrae]|uniref:alginate O-acetyltransferase AlgX-related protein n=1 Tax=Deinococcus alpinitundrae TaxID=468913 RepID=UPI001379FBDD|nr:hypothetical protein [Deinococcus alpinitundrae]
MKRLMVLGTFLLAIAQAQELPTVVQGKSNWLFTNEELQRFTNTRNVYNEQLSALAQAVHMLRERHIEVAVMIIPTKASIYSEFLPDNLKASLDYNGSYRRITADLNRLGIINVDLKTPLIAHKSEGKLYFKTDSHWTPLGMKVAAEAIAKSLASQLRPLAEINISAEDLPAIPSHMDLIDHIPKNQQSHFETEAIGGLSLTLDNTDLLSDAPIPAVTLFGTSYSAVFDGRGLPTAYEQTFSKALKVATKRDILSFAIGGKGFWQSLADYIQSNEYKFRNPRLILWEIPERFLYFESQPDWAIHSFPWLEREVTRGKSDCLLNFANCDKTSSAMRWVMDWNILDIVKGVNPYVTEIKNFFGSENLLRNAGPERSDVSFWLPTLQPVTLDVTLSTPVPEQRVRIFLNNKILKTVSLQLNGEYKDRLTLPGKPGLNRLEFHYDNWNGKTMLFKSGDKRGIAVTFTQLKLTR